MKELVKAKSSWWILCLPYVQNATGCFFFFKLKSPKYKMMSMQVNELKKPQHDLLNMKVPRKWVQPKSRCYFQWRPVKISFTKLLYLYFIFYIYSPYFAQDIIHSIIPYKVSATHPLFAYILNPLSIWSHDLKS